MEEELDFTKLRYVLYARKSTIDETRQIRSIPDQIDECQQLAKRLHLKIVDIIKEVQSAKKPHIRAQFTQMLKDIKNGKYDGILAWNPDRLARNMKEGGDIIDMIDNNQIKDLKFVTHHFTKDANGKMLLGIAFVLSKQYSDKLSQDVTRGTRRNFAEGTPSTPKHGYYTDANKMYRPDGENFELVKKAWEMRAKGTSIDEIATYMDQKGYERVIKSTGDKQQMTKQKLSRMYIDPFYYGVLIHGVTGEKVDLRIAYDFEPVVTEELYIAVQQLSYRRIKPNKSHKTSFYPLRMMLKCSFCEGNMYIAPSTGYVKYLYARCDNKGCRRSKKSIRMKIIFDFIYDFLEEGLNFSEKEYEGYFKDTTKISSEKREKLNFQIHSKQAVMKKIDGEIKLRSLGIIKLSKGSEMWKVNENKVNELSNTKQELEEEITRLKEQVTDPESDRLSIEDFLNLSKNASRVVQSANAVVKDQICRLIFSNFSVDEEKVLSYQLKDPFATLLKSRVVLDSRGGET